MKIWTCHKIRLFILFLIVVICLFLLVDAIFLISSWSCSYRKCSNEDESNKDAILRHALSDLNGIEICLSFKFVDPFYKVKLDRSPQSKETGGYNVVYNYLKSSRFYGENETVTYSTHSTPEFMEHIGNIADRWDGPVSVALYVPATDFCRTIHKLVYLRNCDKFSYREKVSWHLFWHSDYPPSSNWQLVPDESYVDCDKLSMDYKSHEDLRKTWRSTHKIAYPVNVARNVARQGKYLVFARRFSKTIMGLQQTVTCVCRSVLSV